VNVLVIEDDRKAARLLAQGLIEEGFDTEVVGSAEEAEQRSLQTAWDLIVLDWMLPHRSGIWLCQRLREQRVGTPILLLTARDAIEDRVSALNAGADDYLTKPFAFAELVARAHALLRRSSNPREPQLVWHGLALDPVRQRATIAGRLLDLTRKEYAILELLVRRSSEVVEREELARIVWHAGLIGIDNLIDVHVGNLRRKLEHAGLPAVVATVRGKGFRLTREDG
jgi:DNA-binding response OmpR family regulator